MKKLIVSIVLAGLAAFAWALPTLQQVEAQVRQGNFAQAESMMREVVAARPDSARAHYVYAELLAHGGKLDQAVEEARAARTIDPDVKFTDPEKFRTFEASLLRAQNPAARLPSTTAPVETRSAPPAAATRAAPVPAPSGMPGWVWLAGLPPSGSSSGACSRAAVPGRWRAVRWHPARATGRECNRALPAARRTAEAPYPARRTHLMDPATPPQRPGSGMLGVGLGAAGGLAAGMLAERMLNSRREGSGDPLSASPGLFDAPQGGSAADDLDHRPIDFGTGGSDWDSGSSDVGGADGGGWLNAPGALVARYRRPPRLQSATAPIEPGGGRGEADHGEDAPRIAGMPVWRGAPCSGGRAPAWWSSRPRRRRQDGADCGVSSVSLRNHAIGGQRSTAQAPAAMPASSCSSWRMSRNPAALGSHSSVGASRLLASPIGAASTWMPGPAASRNARSARGMW